MTSEFDYYINAILSKYVMRKVVIMTTVLMILITVRVIILILKIKIVATLIIRVDIIVI